MLRDMPRAILVLVAVALLLGATFCLFDADHEAQLDLCNLLLLPIAALALGAPTWLVTRVASASMRMDLSVPPDPTFPPPRP